MCQLGKELSAARQLTAELLAENSANAVQDKTPLWFADTRIEARSASRSPKKQKNCLTDFQTGEEVMDDVETRIRTLEHELQRSQASRMERHQRSALWLDRATSTETLLELRQSALTSSATQLSQSGRLFADSCSWPTSPNASQSWLHFTPPPVRADEDLQTSKNASQHVVPSRISGLPNLPMDDTDFGWARGPHDSCHFILPNVLLVGSYPGAPTEPLHTSKIRSLLKAGIDCFVCLQESWELRTRCPAYIDLAQEMFHQLHWSHGSRNAPLECWHCPIPDQSVTTIARLEAAVATIVDRILSGRRVYLHSWGGNGRAGTVACALLVKAYGLSAEEAGSYFMVTHRTRRSHNSWSPGCWPHSPAQFAQVKQMEVVGRELSAQRLPRLEPWTS